jgi:hypothetical protein
MLMSSENFSRAIQLITSNLHVKVSFNVPIEGSYSSVHQIVIHESNATLTKKLHEEGYSLYPTHNGLSVTKF